MSPPFPAAPPHVGTVMCGYNPPCPGCAGLRWVLAAPHPGLVSAGKVGTSRAVQGEGWHCLVAGSLGAGQYRVWVAGKNSLLFPLKKLLETTGGKKHREQGHSVPCVLTLCPGARASRRSAAPSLLPGLGSCQGSLGKPGTVAAATAASGLAASPSCHRAGRVPLCAWGQPVQGRGALAGGDCWRQAGATWHWPHAGSWRAGGPGWQRGDAAWLGTHHLDQGHSWLGTGFTVLVGKRAGEEAEDGGGDKGYPLSHSTAPVSHCTAPLLRTGLVHR